MVSATAPDAEQQPYSFLAPTRTVLFGLWARELFTRTVESKGCMKTVVGTAAEPRYVRTQRCFLSSVESKSLSNSMQTRHAMSHPYPKVFFQGRRYRIHMLRNLA
ncbi:hypothetical protein GW17_00035564 [Ensete ventricosum]|nr:hypothetical protein GW17_00035564 [Ensete ventricosum]